MSDPLQAWLASQRELTERWLGASRGADASASVQAEMQRWWRSVTETLSPSAQELARQVAEFGPGFLAGTGDALFELFGAPSPGSEPNDPNRWANFAPIGYFREHLEHAQDLARALEEYRRVATQMANTIAHIHADALEILATKVQSLATAGELVKDTRRLYDLWIEAGEQAFSRHALDESFGRVQGELVNAGLRVRLAQQTIAEQFLKSLDLPTRAELNSVHKRLKEFRERLEHMEGAVAKRATE
jgi:hypothetical protein